MRLLDLGGVDRDASAVVGDRGDDVVAQPGRVQEEPLVRALAQHQVEQHVGLVDTESLGEFGGVAQHDRRPVVLGDREPEVAAGDDLLGQPADGLPDLLAEQGAADLVEHPDHRSGHRRCLGGHRLAHRGGDALGDRLDQSLPDRHALLDPLGAAPRGDGAARRRQVGHAVEPVLRESRDVGETGLVAGVRRAVRLLRDDLTGEVTRVVPVDRALVRREHPLQLAEDLLQAAHVPAGEAAEHLLERRAGERVLGGRILAGLAVVRRAVVVAALRGDVVHTSNVLAMLVKPDRRSRTVRHVTDPDPAARDHRRPDRRRRGVRRRGRPACRRDLGLRRHRPRPRPRAVRGRPGLLRPSHRRAGVARSGRKGGRVLPGGLRRGRPPHR